MKFVISEQTDYEVEANTADAALEKFLDAENIRDFPHAVGIRELLTKTVTSQNSYAGTEPAM